MALIDIALRYEKEVGRNDTEPYDDLLKKLTAEIEDALKSWCMLGRMFYKYILI